MVIAIGPPDDKGLLRRCCMVRAECPAVDDMGGPGAQHELVRAEVKAVRAADMPLAAGFVVADTRGGSFPPARIRASRRRDGNEETEQIGE